MINITFFGVRGSTPCSAIEPDVMAETHRAWRSSPRARIRSSSTWARACATSARPNPSTARFNGTALVSHLHWDHVQGLPFFGPVLRGGHLSVQAPAQDNGLSLFESFDLCVRPPFFPVPMDAFPGTLEFHERRDETFMVGDAKVMARHGAAQRPDERLPHRVGRRHRRLHLRSPAACRRWHVDRRWGPRALRGRRPRDPRRAVHGPRVRR